MSFSAKKSIPLSLLDNVSEDDYFIVEKKLWIRREGGNDTMKFSHLKKFLATVALIFALQGCALYLGGGFDPYWHHGGGYWHHGGSNWRHSSFQQSSQSPDKVAGTNSALNQSS